MSRGGLLTILFITVTLILVGYFTLQVSNRHDVRNSDASQSLGEAKETTYEGFSGESIALSDLEGKVRVVNSWASWSPYSKTELPALAQLAAEYEEQGVVVVAMNRGEDPVRAERYLDQFGDLSPLIVLIDPDDAFYGRVGGQAMPETLFFDKRGNLIKHVRGVMTVETMRETLERTIEADK